MIEIPHLETNVTLACQNRCISCNHLVPMHAHDFKATMAEPEEFERDLYHFGRVAKTTIWAAIGGEPLLNPKLCDFLEIARRSDAVGQVEVRTNGQTLAEQPERFWRLVDLLVVTVYADKVSAAAQTRIAELAEEYFVRLEWRRDPPFVKLLEPPTDPQASAAKYRSCWFRTFCRVLDHGHFFRCCTTPFIPKLLLDRPFGTDGLRVDEHLTEEKLAAFLADPETPASCAVCCGTGTPSTVPQEWREVSNPVAWLEASGYTAP